MPNILDRFRLDGQVALVTGSGRGIGAACALGLADAGADVVVTARTREEIDAVASQVRERGRRAIAVPCDVLEPDQRRAVVDAAIEEFGRLDVLVNNVGGFGPKPVLDTSAEDFEACFRFNVTTAFALTKRAVPKIVDTASRGAVVNISSAAGSWNSPGFAAYGTAKSALSFLTRQLAQDFAPKVRVNAVVPGMIRSGRIARLLNDDVERGMAMHVPLARIGEPEDIAGCVLYLASAAASYVTGEVLGVTGGQTHQMEMPRANI